MCDVTCFLLFAGVFGIFLTDFKFDVTFSLPLVPVFHLNNNFLFCILKLIGEEFLFKRCMLPFAAMCPPAERPEVNRTRENFALMGEGYGEIWDAVQGPLQQLANTPPFFYWGIIVTTNDGTDLYFFVNDEISAWFMYFFGPQLGMISLA